MNNLETQIMKHTISFIKNSMSLLHTDEKMEKISEKIAQTASVYGKYKATGNFVKEQEWKKHLEAQLASLETIKAIRNEKIAQQILKNAIMAGIDLAITMAIDNYVGEDIK